MSNEEEELKLSISEKSPSLKEAFRLTEKKLSILVESERRVKAFEKVEKNEELEQYPADCPFCARNVNEKGFFDCSECIVQSICTGSYDVGQYRRALEELRELKEEELKE